MFKRAFFWAMFFSRSMENAKWTIAICVEVRDIKNRSESLCKNCFATTYHRDLVLTKCSPEFTYATYASPRMSSIVGNLNLVLVIALSTAWLHELVTPSQTLGFLWIFSQLDEKVGT